MTYYTTTYWRFPKDEYHTPYSFNSASGFRAVDFSHHNEERHRQQRLDSFHMKSTEKSRERSPMEEEPPIPTPEI